MREATRQLLTDARTAIVTLDCDHPLVCADPHCRVSVHEHEGYGEDGWSCDSEFCCCIAACLGYEPETCPTATQKRDVVARIENALAEAPSDADE